MDTVTFTKTAPPEWLLAMWKEIDDKTFGKGFDCFAENAICNLGVADWHGREAIRDNLRQFIDKGFTAHHDVVEYWDSPLLKVFHGKVGMKFDDRARAADNDAFLLHGRKGANEGQALDWFGRSDCVLGRGRWRGHFAEVRRRSATARSTHRAIWVKTTRLSSPYTLRQNAIDAGLPTH